jgi:hypothetical protein
MKAMAVLALLALVACSEPRAGVAIEARPGAMNVSPTVSGMVGGLNVRVSG